MRSEDQSTDSLVPQAALDAVAALRQSGVDAAEQRIGSKEWNQVNEIDRVLSELPQIMFPLVHRYTPGLYIREILMPKDSLLTSRIHILEHPFVISKGSCSVWSDEKGWERLTAPYTGITKPGTRRVLYIHEDTIWTTFHVTDKTDPAEIIKDVTYDHLKLGHMSEVPADRKQLEDSQ